MKKYIRAILDDLKKPAAPPPTVPEDLNNQILSSDSRPACPSARLSSSEK
jgi:hypothetical protein